MTWYRLGSRKRAVLAALTLWTLEIGRPPSRAELCAELAPAPWATPSAVGRVLRSLVSSGHVTDCGGGHYVLRCTAHDEHVVYSARLDDP